MDKKIQALLYDVVDQVNQQLDTNRQLEKKPDTVLFGENGILDSLGLVNFIVETEQRIQDQFGLTVSLADERAMSQRNSPFRSLSSLADYIGSLLKEKASA